MTISWNRALDIEQSVAKIITQQEINGVLFDKEKAEAHLVTLDRLCDELYDQITKDLGYVKDTTKRTCARPFDKAGGYAQKVVKLLKGAELPIAGPFTYIAPILSERDWLSDKLIEMGWVPKEFTDTGKPKLTEKGEPVESLFKWGHSIGKDLGLWFTYNQRRGTIKNRIDSTKGWLNKLREDGRLTAGADSCGTNTVRMRHRTVVNVPKASPGVIFGKEMRELFIAPEDSWLVGYDAAALEGRTMAHYTWPYDEGEFANEILHGDIHSKNTYIFYDEETVGLKRGDPDFDVYRDGASKNGFYGLVYGAQIPKLCSTLDLPKKRGKKAFEDFWEKNYSLGKLRDTIIKMAESNGWLPGLDGRKIYVRSSHSALNALFQSAGAIIMKYAMVILDHWMTKEGLTYKKVIDQHDESQAEVPKAEVEMYYTGTKEEALALMEDGRIWSKPHEMPDGSWRVGYSRYGELAVLALRRTGTYLDVRCPLDAEYKIGRSWAETH